VTNPASLTDPRARLRALTATFGGFIAYARGGKGTAALALIEGAKKVRKLKGTRAQAAQGMRDRIDGLEEALLAWGWDDKKDME